MRSIARFFGRSPFVPLQMHMEKVAECIAKVPEIFDALERGDAEMVEQLAKEISKLEHDADLVKADIRNSVPRGLFMPVDRANLLEILAMQDKIADRAENIGVLLTLKSVGILEPAKALFREFLEKNIEAFAEVQQIISSLDELLESGFGGPEAERVKEMVDTVALREYQADKIQRDLLREMLRHEDEMSYGDFFVWSRIFRQVAGISNHSENLANVVRLTLDSK